MAEILNRLDQIPFLLPLAIMCMRITDVSISTVRMIMIIRGKRLPAAVLGFFEATIWLTAIAAIFSHIDHWINVVFYGLGFSLGNVVGILIENKMAVGQQVVRFISPDEADRITRTLRARGHGVTEVVASGREGPVGLGLVVTARKKVPALVGIISSIDPKAVITLEDVRHSNYVEYMQPRSGWSWLRALKRR